MFGSPRGGRGGRGTEWLTLLGRAVRRGQPFPGDVRLAAYRPVKVLADAIK